MAATAARTASGPPTRWATKPAIPALTPRSIRNDAARADMPAGLMALFVCGMNSRLPAEDSDYERAPEVVRLCVRGRRIHPSNTTQCANRGRGRHSGGAPCGVAWNHECRMDGAPADDRIR